MGTWNPGPGATAGGDTFTGDGTDEVADGLDGNDTLNGNGGNDTLNGGAGVDVLNGGDGDDNLYTSASTAGAGDGPHGGNGIDTIFAVGNAAGSSIVDLRNVSLSGIERIQFVSNGATLQQVTISASQIGVGLDSALHIISSGGLDALNIIMTSGDLSIAAFTFQGWATNNGINITGASDANTITGSTQRDSIDAGGGNDVVMGGLGNDTLTGGGGVDELYGGDGDDFISESLANVVAGDILDGGAGTNDFISVNAGATVNGVIDFTGCTITGIERTAFHNGSGSVTVRYTGSQVSTGLAANVTYQGTNTAQDIIHIVGGGASYSLASWSIFNWVGATDHLVLDGSNGAESITGSTQRDFISGSGGNDTLDGRQSDDTISGGDGDDTITDLTGSVAAYSVGNGDDIIITNSAATSGAIDGGANTDVLRAYGNVSAVTLTGLEILETVSTNNTVTATAAQLEAFDTIRVANGSTAQVRLTLSEAGTVDLASELGAISVLFTGSTGNDTVTSGSGDDSLSGGNGNDILNGGLGADGLSAGSGVDQLFGGDANDVLNLDTTSGGDADTLDGGAGADTISVLTSGTGATFDLRLASIAGIEALSLTGGGSATTVQLTSGQVLSGLAASLSVTSNLSTTTINISSATAANYSLANWTFPAWHSTNLIDLDGSGDADTITGSVQRDDISGNGGNDSLNGGAGNDTLSGGDSNDTITDTDGAIANYSGGNGNDLLIVNNAATSGTIDGGADTDILRAWGNVSGVTLTGLEILETVSSSNVFTATAAQMESFDTIRVAGASTAQVRLTLSQAGTVDLASELGSISTLFTGSTGDDVITTGSGDDTLDGNGGLDVLNGGDGADTFTVRLASLSVGDTFNGGSGGDTLRLTGPGGGTFEFGVNATVSSIENLTFAQDSGDTIAAFWHAQMGAGLSLSANITGSAARDILSVYGGSVSLANLTFSNWANPDWVNIFGSNGDDVIVGSIMDDAIMGELGVDSMSGGDGADGFYMDEPDVGAGDTYDGGGGNDRIYLTPTNAVAVFDLTTSTITSVEGLTLTNVAGTSNTVQMLASQITEFGGVTFSTLRADTLVITSTSAANYSLAAWTFGNLTVGTDLLQHIGSSSADTITGSLARDSMSGGAGNDVLSGLGADDTLNGEGNDDTLDGGIGNDTLNGGDGNDTITDTSGTVANYSGGNGNDVIIVNNIATSGTLSGGADTDTLRAWGSINNIALSGFEVLETVATGNVVTATAAQLESFDTIRVADGSSDQVRLTLSAGGTVDLSSELGAISALFTGSGGDDTITTGSAADTINGGNGNDTLAGGAGGDTLSGGSGSDTASYAGAASGLVANLANAATNIGDANGDSYSSIENLTGSAFDDTLTGDANANTLTGGAGADTLDGGDGNDTAGYENAAAGVVANLTNAAANTGDAAGDSYTSIEILRGSAFNDTLVGTFQANLLNGGGGDDLLIGGGGADTLAGAAGFDTASYESSALGVSVNLETGLGVSGDADGDTLTSIEGLIGSDVADTLTGRNYVANTLDGGAGDDTIEGGYGGDTLIGGDGVDTLVYSLSLTGVDVRLFNTFAAGGQANGDTHTGFENIRGSDTATDVLAGDAGVNFIWGGGGNETITGREGNDQLFGEAGNDTVLGGAGEDVLHSSIGNDTLGGGADDDLADYSASNAGVTVNLATGAGSGGHAQGDTLVSIEDVIGSAFDDVIIGKANVWDNVFDGGAGNDTLTGGNGNDTFVFRAGDGNDTVTDFAAGGASGDAIQMTGWGANFDTFAEVIAAATQAGADTVFDFGNGQTLTLQNVTLANLNAGDFVFA